MNTISALLHSSSTPRPKRDGLFHLREARTASRSGAFPSKITGANSGRVSKSVSGCASTASPMSSNPRNKSTSTAWCPFFRSAAQILVPELKEIFRSVDNPPHNTTIFMKSCPSGGRRGVLLRFHQHHCSAALHKILSRTHGHSPRFALPASCFPVFPPSGGRAAHPAIHSQECCYRTAISRQIPDPLRGP